MNLQSSAHFVKIGKVKKIKDKKEPTVANSMSIRRGHAKSVECQNLEKWIPDRHCLKQMINIIGEEKLTQNYGVGEIAPTISKLDFQDSPAS